MKVLFWRQEFYGAVTDGGVASLYDGLISGMLDNGIECVFVSSGKMNLDPRVKSYLIEYSQFFRNFPEVLCQPYNIKSFKAISKIIEFENPDFIYQHHHDFVYGGTLVKKKFGIPFILHVDGIQYWTKKNWGKLFLPYLLKWAEQIQFKQSDAIFVVSEPIKNDLLKLNITPDKIYINSNGVNPKKFLPDLSGKRIRTKYKLHGKTVIGFSGTFGKYHGIQVLAKAFASIADAVPDAMLLLIGDGEMRPITEKILKDNGLIDKAIFTGMVTLDDVPEYLAACDILTSPCVTNDDGSDFFNSPIKIFEYMAMQKPIVASAVGQQALVLKQNETAVLVPENNPEILAQSIIELNQNESLKTLISANARQEALERHTWTIKAQNIIEAYKNISTAYRESGQ